MSASGSFAGAGATPPRWPVIITEWALDSYLNLRHANVFTPHDYRSILRPDVELLKDGIPSPHARFSNPKFWGPAKQGNVVLHDGYKMKWHQLGAGQVQLRLPVMSFTRSAFLCEAYVKANSATDQRKMARFKTHMNLIFQGRYIYRGAL
jgi:hypothetical protein